MRLASRSFRAIAIVPALAGMPLFAGSAAMAGEQTDKFAGTWKLIVLALGEDEFAIINVDAKNGKPAASVVNIQKMMLGDANVEQVAIQGDSLVIALRGAAGLNRFQGTLARDGSQAGKILGSFSFRGEVYPARLERTESQRVAELEPSAIIQEYFTAVRERDPKSKVRKLQDAARKHEGNPTNYFFYGEQYRGIIDTQLEAAKEATIHVSATRTGDEIKIAAQATVTGKRIANENEPAPAKDVGADAENARKIERRPRPRLRLALTEESIRCIGINKLRYHHHEVRDFPGGLEGRDLSSGSGELRITINVADLKRDIENYLSHYSKERAFPNSFPDIALKDLTVVAFVQDDADKTILHAVAVPVK